MTLMLTVVIGWIAASLIWTLGYVVGHSFGRQSTRCDRCERARAAEVADLEAMWRRS